MNKKTKRINEALQLLKDVGMPHEQLNNRTAITLLAILGLTVRKNWSEASSNLIGIRGILDFARNEMDFDYAENSRESVRKHSVKQLVSAGIVLHNPDDPTRPVNSSKNCYQIEQSALVLFKSFDTKEWGTSLKEYLRKRPTLVQKFARQREMNRIPINVKKGMQISLSPGPHSNLIRDIIEQFASRYIPGGDLVYVGDTGSKWGYFDSGILDSLNVKVDEHGKMPDVVIYLKKKNWLVLIEAVASSGPVDSIRHNELQKLFSKSTAGLVFVTAFPNRGEILRKFLSVVAWETEVWCASDPSHLIHFNGERFLGPY